MEDYSRFSFTEGFSGIKVEYIVEPSGLFKCEVIYNDKPLYYKDVNTEHTVTIPEEYKSYSSEGKYLYVLNFQKNVGEFMAEFNNRNANKDNAILTNNRFLLLIIFPEIQRVLLDDYQKSLPHTNDQNICEKEENKSKPAKLYSTEAFQRDIDHTLAYLLKDQLAIKKKKNDKVEYCLTESLRKVIDALRAKKQSGIINIPDETNIFPFIKNYLKDKNGKSLDDNIRQFQFQEKGKLPKTS